MREIWNPLPNSDGEYEVSNLGRVRSLKNSMPKILRHQVSNPVGHRKLDLRIGGKRSPRWVHRLVLEAFVGPCPPGMQVRHLDGDPSNNHLDNLAYGSPSENMHDVVRHGRHNSASKTHCKHGHPLSGANLYVHPSGQRKCRICTQRSRSEYEARTRQGWNAHPNLRPAIEARVAALKSDERQS